ncbi:MAG: hypothetical protein QMD46_03460 [Methanomicrobiales archaeon]|nr:hypothetical protein [Methanomicrobiales archaeon]MDI6876014.1 hypothetical protein [Methanomicrobiales archaeon]
MSVYEIHLNRRGINSLEAPKQAEVETGSDLELRLINHGHPVHLTLSALNPKPYTHFVHENLYIDDEETYPIPIRTDAQEGSFDLEVIAGYGSRRSRFSVIVKKAEEKVEQPAPEPARAAFTVPEQIRTPSALLAIAALVAYAVWLLAFPSSAESVLVNVFAFLLLIGGFVAAWSRRGS